MGATGGLCGGTASAGSAGSGVAAGCFLARFFGAVGGGALPGGAGACPLEALISQLVARFLPAKSCAATRLEASTPADALHTRARQHRLIRSSARALGAPYTSMSADIHCLAIINLTADEAALLQARRQARQPPLSRRRPPSVATATPRRSWRAATKRRFLPTSAVCMRPATRRAASPRRGSCYYKGGARARSAYCTCMRTVILRIISPPVAGGTLILSANGSEIQYNQRL